MANFKLDVDGDGIALVTWDMADRSMNVITMDVIAELGTVVDKVANDAAIKGAVITSGKEAFCGGADLTMLESMRGLYTDMVSKQGEEAAAKMVFDESRKLSQLYRRIETCGKPWVCALNGTAMGGGFELALACHYRVASDDAKTRLGLPEIKIGLFPGAGGTQRVARMLQPADALQFLLKGDQLKVDRAKAMKLIDAVVPASRPDQDRKGLDQGRRQGQGAVGHRGFPSAGRPGLFQGRDDDVPGGQRDLPARDLRQLSGCARHSAGRLRRPAVADRHGAARRVALVREDPALAGSGGDDPHRCSCRCRISTRARAGRRTSRRQA